MAEPRAVVDVVAAEAGAHQFLEQVGLFVAALRAAEAGERLRAVRVTQAPQCAAGKVERLFPGRLAEHARPVGRVRRHRRVFRYTGLADQRLRQTLRVARVIEAEAALHAQPAVVGRAVAAINADYSVVAHVVGQQAADAAERADRIDSFVDHLRADRGLWHQRAGRAGLHALTTGHAGALAHLVVEVEHDSGVRPAHRHADHVVDLLLATGAHAAVALDAGLEIDDHRRVRVVGRRLLTAQRTQFGAHGHAFFRSPLAQLAVRQRAFRIDPLVARLRQVGEQHLEHHLLALLRAHAVGRDDHAGQHAAAATRREHALALDLDDARAAVAVGAVAVLEAQGRDRDAFALGDAQDGLVAERADDRAVERERNTCRLQVCQSHRRIHDCPSFDGYVARSPEGIRPGLGRPGARPVFIMLLLSHARSA